jgi:hypothetical protein
MNIKRAVKKRNLWLVTEIAEEPIEDRKKEVNV